MAASTLIPPQTWAQGKIVDVAAQNVTQEIVIRATGAEGARLDGECLVKTTTGERSLTVASPLPFEQRVDGAGLSCRLAATGSADIEVRAGGNVSRTRTSGGTVRLSIGS